MDELNEAIIIEMGYESPRKLPDGRWLAVHKMAFTTGLMVKIDLYGYHHRYCYTEKSDALKALEVWDGCGCPPGPWIKRKGAGGDLTNPEWKNPHEKHSQEKR